MRRSFKRPRIKKVKPPKPIPPPKPNRPKRGTLKRIYRDLLTYDTEQRVNTLRKVMAWYDQCQVYVMYKQEGSIRTRQLKEQNLAQKCRAQGINLSNSDKKEKAFIAAIEHYEKMLKSFKPPLIKEHLKKLKEKIPKLEETQTKLKDKYGEFLDLLNRSLQPKNYADKRINLRVDKISSEYSIDAEGNVTFDRRFLSTVKKLSRKFGLLSGIIKALPILAQAAGQHPEKDQHGHLTGNTLVSNKKMYHSVLDMITSLYQHARLEKKIMKLVRNPRQRQKGTDIK